MRRSLVSIVFAALLVVRAAAYVAQTDAGLSGASEDRWVVQHPYESKNPLKRVILLGSATVGTRSGKAVLIVGCHPDDGGVSTVGVRLRDGGMGFDLDAFEGEDGAGTHRKLLTFALSDSPPIIRTVNGSGQEGNEFELDFEPSMPELRRLLSSASAGKPFILTLHPPSGKGPVLVMHFQLPADNGALKIAISPCLH